MPYFEKAVRLNPREPYIGTTYGALGANHLFARHTDQAINFLRRAQIEIPWMWWIRLVLAGALDLKGDVDEARAEVALWSARPRNRWFRRHRNARSAGLGSFVGETSAAQASVYGLLHQGLESRIAKPIGHEPSPTLTLGNAATFVW